MTKNYPDDHVVVVTSICTTKSCKIRTPTTFWDLKIARLHFARRVSTKCLLWAAKCRGLHQSERPGAPSGARQRGLAKHPKIPEKLALGDKFLLENFDSPKFSEILKISENFGVQNFQLDKIENFQILKIYNFQNCLCPMHFRRKCEGKNTLCIAIKSKIFEENFRAGRFEKTGQQLVA